MTNLLDYALSNRTVFAAVNPWILKNRATQYRRDQHDLIELGLLEITENPHLLRPTATADLMHLAGQSADEMIDIQRERGGGAEHAQTIGAAAGRANG